MGVLSVYNADGSWNIGALKLWITLNEPHFMPGNIEIIKSLITSVESHEKFLEELKTVFSENIDILKAKINST